MNVSGDFTEIVKPMERGQITIPINIRKKLKITPKSWLWVKLTDKDKILIEPVSNTPSSINFVNYLTDVISDKKIYWTKQDSLALEKVRKRSWQRLKKLI